MSAPVEVPTIRGVRRWRREVVFMTPTKPGEATASSGSVVASSGQEAAYQARLAGANKPRSKVRVAT